MRINCGLLFAGAIGLDLEPAALSPVLPLHARILHVVLSFNGLRGLYQLQSERNDLIGSATKSGNSSCTESLSAGKHTLSIPGTAASASISARERDGVSAP